jgi:hypothetical protein
MLQRIFAILTSAAMGLLASAAVLVLAGHPAGVVWAAPAARPLADVLTVGGACGTTIQACVDFANPGDEVHIPAGLYTESVTVDKAISVTGDLSSTTIIHAVDSQRVMTITGAASVSLADLTLTGGVVTSTDFTSNCGGDLQVMFAAAQLENLTLTDGSAKCGGGLGVLSSSVTLIGVDVTNNSAEIGGGVGAAGATLMMSDGTIEHNSASLAGGGVLLDHSDMTLAGGWVYSNSGYIGGGLGLMGPGVILTQTGGTVEGNSAQQSGGGLAMDGSLFTMAGGAIVSNTVQQKGGGVASFSGFINGVQLTGQFVLVGGDVSSNSAGVEGGGVYLNGPQSYFTQTSGTIEHNSATYLGGGLYQEGGHTWLQGTGQIFSNSAGYYGGGVSLYGTSSIFSQSGGVVSHNQAQYGGGLDTDGALVTLSGGSILSNSAQYGGGIAAFSDSGAGQVILAGGTIVSNSATIEGGGLYQDGSAAFFTQTSGSLENNVGQYLAGGIFQMRGQVALTGGDIIGNHSDLGGGLVIWGPDSVFNQTGGQVSYNTADSMGAMYIGHTGSVTVSIGGGLIYSNSANSAGIGAIGVDSGSLVAISGTRILSNTGGEGGAVTQFAFTGPVSVTVADSCIVGNGPITSVVNTGGPTIDARGNWWGAADGPAGAGPGSGDAVSSGVDYSGFLAQAASICSTPMVNLIVSSAGTGAGAVTSSPAGIDCGLACAEALDQGTAVTLTATPALSSTFAGWSGACNGLATCDLTLSQSTQVTATFALKVYSLTVSPAGNGSGAVSSVPPSINCGGTCSAVFDYGTAVTLTATPMVSSTFTGWSGACGGSGACAVTMTQPAAVTATFAISSYALTVGSAGNGNGHVTSEPPGVDCGGACDHAYKYGTVVTLTATLAMGTSFAGWSGACAGWGWCIVTMTQPAAVTATFTLNGEMLTAAKAGTGAGTVTGVPGSIDCGAACSQVFDYGTVVSLTAAPAASSSFAGWQGACAGSAACVVTLTQPSLVTATFSLKSYPLTVMLSGTGGGSVTSLPAGLSCSSTCAASFSYGSALTLTAVPSTDSSFAGWSEPCAGTGPCGLVITQAMTVTAEFDARPPQFKLYLPMLAEGAAAAGAPYRKWAGGWRVLDGIFPDWQ